jgi:hypothetical protein
MDKKDLPHPGVLFTVLGGQNEIYNAGVAAMLFYKGKHYPKDMFRMRLKM